MAKTDSEPQTQTAYVITRGMVGPHREGEVITYDAKQLAAGHDPARLLRIGAVREATPEDGEAVPYGQAGEEMLPVFPAVPFQPPVPAPAAEPA